ncbi:3-hydroxyacyl-CoA dehydrogenase NAD-binding domain-containing protein [Desulfomonile tiedjei]|uniref:3-hydroxyacyl-CoA dehydrogenase n=1 Tax=Desulfomonile tiedjei (strain ATCC 49306 / DSM 6799 / DCB-1) TaxID=706587 RepID=I4C5J4_DESTA|nr:3-hydroxyacyl-CoA dehydrogenase NAD-binding domain-containing protein [Desulfomonile tiedjei]AFM24835.1 3-hydroxyacyl-CoA dehydrogenase [Desulfomonile tiedjei DSM 6799]
MKTDFMTIHVKVQDNVAVLFMNNPPVNQLSQSFVDDLAEAVSSGFDDPTVKGIVLTGTGKNFIAGADLTEIYVLKEKESLLPRVEAMSAFFHQIELGPKPVIAAINGNALGGGLELAMACHYRVALHGVQLGQPEVKVGLIPGAGGTQRLPRFVGLHDALEMMTVGDPIDSRTALSRGLIDEVTEPEHFLRVALSAATNLAEGTISLESSRTRNRNNRLPSSAELKAVTSAARVQAEKKAKGYLAPFKVIEALENGLSPDIEADIRREGELFAECALSDVAKNLIGIFLNTRAAGRLTRISRVKPADTKQVAVLGGGVMGSGIVNLLLRRGFDAVLWDITEEAVDRGVASVRKTFEHAIKRKKMLPTELETLLDKRLRVTTSLEDMQEADLIIEAVIENMDIKQSIWKQLEEICKTEAVFATNTSALPIAEIASILKDQGRAIGLHFFNPAHQMQLLEIICTQKTSDLTLATSVAFARAIGKIPVIVNDSPGFYVSRQLGGLLGGAVYLMADGVDWSRIENAMKDFGMPMGPAELADLTGIDINYHVYKTFEQRLGPRYKMHPLMESIYQTGCYGRKTGMGYMDYGGDELVPNKKVLDVIQNYLSDNHVSPKNVSDQEIIDTMLALAINEGALIIEEGVCDEPQHMDLAMIYGTGFPPFRGGIFRYADKWGIANVYETLIKLERQFGPRFEPSNLLKKMVEAGRTFYPA